MLRFLARVFFSSIVIFVAEVIVFMISLMTFCHLDFELMGSWNFYITSGIGFIFGVWLSFLLVWKSDLLDQFLQAMIKLKNF